jgi:hypothetical protein
VVHADHREPTALAWPASFPLQLHRPLSPPSLPASLCSRKQKFAPHFRSDSACAPPQQHKTRGPAGHATPRPARPFSTRIGLGFNDGATRRSTARGADGIGKEAAGARPMHAPFFYLPAPHAQWAPPALATTLLLARPWLPLSRFGVRRLRTPTVPYTGRLRIERRQAT